jgi:arginine-tRNA-protein transferase
MITLATFVSPSHDCAYRPGEEARIRYEIVDDMTLDEYHGKLNAGWRRFGHSLFQPACPECQSCRALRVIVNEFQPNRSQQRAWRANTEVELSIHTPAVRDETLVLYDRFHRDHSERIGWPDRGEKDPQDFYETFVANPVATEEWHYMLDGELLGAGFVDPLPDGLSAIYFVHDPDHRERSLGTLNVLRIIDRAKQLKLPYVYLGFAVAHCRSLEYKAKFAPYELLQAGGGWKREALA